MEENDFYKKIGNNISHIRISKGINQNQLSEKLKLSRPSIANIEKGNQRPSIFLLMQISSYFNVSILDLIPLIKNEDLIPDNIISLDVDKSQLLKNDGVVDFLKAIKQKEEKTLIDYVVNNTKKF